MARSFLLWKKKEKLIEISKKIADGSMDKLKFIYKCIKHFQYKMLWIPKIFCVVYHTLSVEYFVSYITLHPSNILCLISHLIRRIFCVLYHTLSVEYFVSYITLYPSNIFRSYICVICSTYFLSSIQRRKVDFLKGSVKP